MDRIGAPMDFLGINYYSREIVAAGPGGEPVPAGNVPPEELTDMGWEVFPEGLLDVLVRIRNEYRPPKIYVTENGAAYRDPDSFRDPAPDERRVSFLRDHLAAAHRALEEGVPLAGYFVWSLMDNFEWAHGYTKKFGLHAVDFATQERSPRASAFWYRDAALRGRIDDDPQPATGRSA
jgi:beta-glucosidase